MSGYGWKGMQVRNVDGRKGRIRKECPDFMGLDLYIAVEGGDEVCIRMNASYPDSGEPGWSWLSENFLGGAAWLPLGSHSGVSMERAEVAEK